MQTFVLAEQPNGYFVLNDIFRYLNDDEDEIVEDELPQAEEPAVEAPPTPAEGVPDVQPDTEDQVVTEDAAEKVDEQLEEEQAEVPHEDVVEINGDEDVATAEESVDAPEGESFEEEVVADTTEATTAEQPAEPETTPPPAETATEASPPAPAPTSDAPTTKKTWASMLGGGGAVAAQKPAIPALPVTAPAQSKAPRPAQPTQASKTSTESATATTPPTASTPTSQSNGWQMAESSKKSKAPQNKVSAEGTTLAYIKNVNEKVDARILREVLENYGELKYFDVSRPRVSNCPLLSNKHSILTTAELCLCRIC